MSINNNTTLTQFCNLQASSFSVIYGLVGSAGVLMKSGLCRQLCKGLFQVESPLKTLLSGTTACWGLPYGKIGDANPKI